MGRKQTGFDKETLENIGKHFASLVDYARDKENLTAKEVYQQIYGDDDISNKESKISQMKIGKSITAYDVMKIQAWKNLSLDWLLLGKGNPPPELQETQERGSSDEWAASNTVRGFLTSLMCLSLAKYTRNMKIETHGHDYFYHDIHISFSFVPFDISPDDDEDDKYYSLDPDGDQCDTVSYLVQGLRALSSSKLRLLEMPTNDHGAHKLKIDKYDEILDSIPQNQTLDNYRCEHEKNFVTLDRAEMYFPNDFLPIIRKHFVCLPEKY